MATGKLTIRQIAKLAGVARSTVSRVINNHPNVSPEKREQVLRVIREYDYRPDPVARSLGLRRTERTDDGQSVEDSGGKTTA